MLMKLFNEYPDLKERGDMMVSNIKTMIIRFFCADFDVTSDHIIRPRFERLNTLANMRESVSLPLPMN